MAVKQFHSHFHWPPAEINVGTSSNAYFPGIPPPYRLCGLGLGASADLGAVVTRQKALLEHIPFGEMYSVESGGGLSDAPLQRHAMAILSRERIDAHPNGHGMLIDFLSDDGGCWGASQREDLFFNESYLFVVLPDPLPDDKLLKEINDNLQLYEEAEEDPAIALEPGEDVTRDYEFDGGNAEYARIGAGGFGSVYRVRHKSRANEPMRVVKVINKAQYAQHSAMITSRHLAAEIAVTRSSTYSKYSTIFTHISKQVALYHSPWRIFLVLELVNADKPPLDLSTRLYHLYATVKPRKIANVPALLQKRAMTEPATSDDAIVREALADVGVAEEIPATADVHEMLLRRPHFLVPHRKAVLLAKRMLEAVHAIHQFNIVHRDLKMQNVVVSELRRVEVLDGGRRVMMEEKVVVRLIDFGLAKVLKPRCWSPQLPPRGSADKEPTPGLGQDITMALEMWKSTQAGRWTSDVAELPKLDVYGVGIVLYCICRARYPYSIRDVPGYADMTSDEQQNALVALIERGVESDEFWCDSRHASNEEQRSSADLLSNVLRPLITALMDNNVKKRPTAAQALDLLHKLSGGAFAVDDDDDAYRFFVDTESGLVTEVDGNVVSSPTLEGAPSSTDHQYRGAVGSTTTTPCGLPIGMPLTVVDLRADDSSEKVGDALRNIMEFSDADKP